MKPSNYQVLIKTANKDAIYEHLNNCNDSFIPKLSEYVDLKKYSNKLYESSITFEIWDNSKLIGLVAGYFNDTINHEAFITNVSIIPDYNKKGIGDLLLNCSLEYAKEHNFKKVILEVSKYNHVAIKLYKKHKFVITERENDKCYMVKNF